MKNEREIEVFRNYGCLAADKRIIYSHPGPIDQAVLSEKICILVPEGFCIGENVMEETLIIAPWKLNYMVNELLGGNKHPYFTWADDGGSHYIKLKYREL